MVEIMDYKNKLFSIMGDSISALKGYIPDDFKFFYPRAEVCEDIVLPSDIWWGKVIDALGGKLLKDGSWSGTLIGKHPMCTIPSYGCSDLRVNVLGSSDISPDIIMIFMGMNDAGWDMKIFPTCASEQEDISIFSVAYHVMSDKIRATYPNSEVWCLSLPYAPAYSDVIKNCAESYNFKLIELDLYTTFDGLHPDKHGMEQIANSVLASLKK